jgi:hypothetical protein
MRYRVHSAWPVQGGARVIYANTEIDTSLPNWSFLVGVVPPPDVTPLDSECQNCLALEYSPQGGGAGKCRM